MARQIPSKASRGLRNIYNPDDAGMHYEETNTDYLNEHACDWEPPLGHDRHLHLIYSKQVHWRVVEQGSAVCKIPGRCYRVDIDLKVLREV